MKTSIKLREWSGVDDTIHVATSYRIATDETMLNVIDEIIESSDKLTLYNSDVTIPLNTTYYVSVKRKIMTSTGSVVGTVWTTPTPIRNYESPTGIMVEEDIYVDMPYIYVDKNEILDIDMDTFLFRTSEFRSNSEGHSATHFFIYDSLGNLIFSRMNEVIGKLGIRVNKADVNTESSNELLFKVIHVTPTGIESPVSSLYVNLSKSNVAITSRLKNVVPFTDYTLRLAKVNSSNSLRIVSILVMNIDETEEMWSADIVPDKLDYIIPYRLLSPNSKYVVKVTTNHIDGFNVIKKVMTTIESLGDQRNQPNFVYKNKVKHLSNSFGPLLTTDSAYTLLNNGKVITKDTVGKGFKIWDVDILNYKLTNPVVVSGLTTLVDGDDSVYINIREDGTILIDCLNNFGYATFLLYKYDSFRNSAVLLHTIVRSEESKTISFNNGIVRDNADIYYYIPVGKNYINKLDLTNVNITKIYDINNTSIYNVLTRLDSGKLAIFTGTDVVLSFDSSLGMLRKVEKEYEGPNVNYESSILLSSGELLLLHNVLETDQYYIYY